MLMAEKMSFAPKPMATPIMISPAAASDTVIGLSNSGTLPAVGVRTMAMAMARAALARAGTRSLPSRGATAITPPMRQNRSRKRTSWVASMVTVNMR